MQKAVDRILEALNRGEKILIYGDYDADGITAVSLLYSCLQDWGGRFLFIYPAALIPATACIRKALKAAEQGTGLIITVDCGENAQAEIHGGGGKGMDVIVTDHHQPQGEVWALAHINPLREDAVSHQRTWRG
jgi:single-stranded-DNA-specific exonuclease